MKAAPFEFVRPDDAADAVRRLMATGDGAKICGGSQSLGPMLNLRLVQVEQLVGLAHITALKQAQVDGDVLRIGAAVTHARIEDGDLPDLTAGLLRFILRQPGPCDLRIGKHNRRDGNFVEGRRLARNHFRCDASLMSRLVRQHWIARDIADRQDMWIGGPLTVVPDHESSFIDLDLRVLQSQALGHRSTADADQHAVVSLVTELARSFERHFNLIAHFGQ